MKDNCFIAIVPSHQRRRIIAIIRLPFKQSCRDHHNIVVAQSRHRDIDPDLGGALVNNTVLSGFHNNFLKHLNLYSGPKCRKTEYCKIEERSYAHLLETFPPGFTILLAALVDPVG